METDSIDVLMAVTVPLFALNLLSLTTWVRMLWIKQAKEEKSEKQNES